MTVERYNKKHTLKVTLPDGREITRKTDRVYRFVVAGYDQVNKRRDGSDWGWGAEWTSRKDLAEKKLQGMRNWTTKDGTPIYKELRIISVTQPLIPEHAQMLKDIQRMSTTLDEMIADYYKYIERDEYNAEWLAYLS